MFTRQRGLKTKSSHSKASLHPTPQHFPHSMCVTKMYLQAYLEISQNIQKRSRKCVIVNRFSLTSPYVYNALKCIT